jgi:hypothetical protein
MMNSRRSYGWSSYFESRFKALGHNDLSPGRVLQNQRGHLKIWTADGVVDARHSAAQPARTWPSLKRS